MMRQLHRYIAGEILIPSLIAVTALTFVALLRETGWITDVIIRQSASMGDVGTVLMAILPQVLRFTIPMALLVGLLTGFGRLSADGELIAIRALGISAWLILLPVLGVATLAWSADQALSAWVSPGTAARVQAAAREIARNQIPFEIQEGVFNRGLGDFVIFARHIEPAGVGFHGIMLADLSRSYDPIVTFARSGTVRRNDSNHTFEIALSDGTTVAQSGYSVLSFGQRTLTVAMPDFPAVPESFAVLETPTRELWKRVREGMATSQEQLELHSRIALPFACFAFAMVGVPLGMSAIKANRSRGLLVGLVLVMCYYASFIGATHLA